MNDSNPPEPSELLDGFLKFIDKKGFVLQHESLLEAADSGDIDNVAVLEDGDGGRVLRVIDSYLCGRPTAAHTRNLYRATLKHFLKKGYLASPPRTRGTSHAHLSI